MPKVVKQELKTEKFMSIDELFTDRQDARDLFWRVYNGMEADEYQVVHFFGIGGIGKTILLEKICREMDEKIPKWGKLDHAFFSFEGHASKDEFLFSLSRQMMLCNRGLKFPLFDTAIRRLWIEENHDLAKLEQRTQNIFLQNPIFEGLMEGVKDTIPSSEVIGELAGGFLESTAEKGLVKLVERIIKITGEKIAEKEQLEGPNAALYQEIKFASGKTLRSNLHTYFLRDVQDVFQKRTRPYAVCIDGYEKYVNRIKEGELAHYTDDWFSDMESGLVNIANVIWVISGRERLHWSEELLPEDQVLKINDMSNPDSKTYFTKAGISDEKLTEQLWTLSNGTPVYMDLCVKAYYSIKKNKEPAIADFGHDIAELVKRYFEEMDDADRHMMVMLASMPNTWEKEFAKDVAIRVHYDMYLPKLDNLLSLSIFDRIDTGYKMHETVRQAVKSVYPKEVSGIQEEILRMLAEQIQNLSDIPLQDITPKPRMWHDFFYMLSQVDTVLLDKEHLIAAAAYISLEIELTGDYPGRMEQLETLIQYAEKHDFDAETQLVCQTKRNENLLRIGQLDQGLTCALETYEYGREHFGMDNLYMRVAEQALGTAYMSLGNDEKAEECYKRLYDYACSNRENALEDLIAASEGLGTIYLDEDPEKAREYLLECFSYYKEAFGENHFKTLIVQFNLLHADFQTGADPIATIQQMDKIRSIAAEKLGEKHPIVQSFMDTIALLLLRSFEFAID